MSRIILFIAFLLISTSSFGQSSAWNAKKGFVAQGYDVVSYFDNKAKKGKEEYIAEYQNVKFKFSSKENKDKFVSNPEEYSPQYGGYCAYAIGKKGEKVSINPKSFEIRDGKLFLFYNKLFTNTYEKWIDEGADDLKIKADANWIKINENK